tara:strand:+ start:168 stop:428 length:261 start_codon:yes stop_codon:yes gene_type:complete
MINLDKYHHSAVNIINLFANKVKSKFFPSFIQKEVMKWYRDGGDFELRFNYSLNTSSIVFDLGGLKETLLVICSLGCHVIYISLNQ